MNFIIIAITTLLLIATVESLKPLKHKQPSEEIDQISHRQLSRRAIKKAKLSLARQIYNKLKQSHLRDVDSARTVVDHGNEEAAQAEAELKSTLKQTKAALQERPFLEHKGKNDFLVMGTDDRDKFATVIPNYIYYNVEKKCVNWLDDCSLKGIRQKLLRGVQTP